MHPNGINTLRADSSELASAGSGSRRPAGCTRCGGSCCATRSDFRGGKSAPEICIYWRTVAEFQQALNDTWRSSEKEGPARPALHSGATARARPSCGPGGAVTVCVPPCQHRIELAPEVVSLQGVCRERAVGGSVSIEPRGRSMRTRIASTRLSARARSVAQYASARYQGQSSRQASTWAEQSSRRTERSRWHRCTVGRIFGSCRFLVARVAE
jgi:hypothetical protein